MATTLERRPPARHRFDVADYYRMAEAGILSPEDRVELIDGEVVDMAPIGSSHAFTTDQLNDLASSTGARQVALVAVQRPLRLDPHNEPQPDLMLLKRPAESYRDRHPAPAEVLLLIEVAESSLASDKSRKVPLYARFGVPEVWVVDLPGQAVEVFRRPEDGGYRIHERFTAGQVAAELVPSFVVDVAALLA